MSFINLMASDVWSAADIDNRVQSMIRSRFSAQDELRAARLARKPDATEGEAAFVASVDAWIAECIEQGHQARVDMALLHEVLAHEQAAASAKQAREAALAWNEALLSVEPEEGEAVEVADPQADLPEPVEPLEPVEVPDLLADPVPGDEIHSLWVTRNPPVPEPIADPVEPIVEAEPITSQEPAA